MENFDSIKSHDEVKVSILGPENEKLYETSGSGFHSIGAAIEAAVSAANLQIPPEDCVFVVSNLTSGVTHKYRFNAHGHLAQLPEL